MKKNFRTLMSLALLLAFCFVFTAQAQVIARADVAKTVDVDAAEKPVDAPENPIAFLASQKTVSDTWVAEIDRQYAAWLKRTDDPSRGKALQEIIMIANQHGDKVTFSKAVSPLLGVYIFDENKKHRLMALSALHAIGDRYGMQRLRELVNDEPSEQVRRLTHYALADYYGPRINTRQELGRATEASATRPNPDHSPFMLTVNAMTIYKRFASEGAEDVAALVEEV